MYDVFYIEWLNVQCTSFIYLYSSEMVISPLADPLLAHGKSQHMPRMVAERQSKYCMRTVMIHTHPYKNLFLVQACIWYVSGPVSLVCVPCMSLDLCPLTCVP